MITSVRSALSSFGVAAHKLFRPDHGASESRQQDLASAKRLKHVPPTSKNHDALKSHSNDGVAGRIPDFTSDAFRRSRTAGAGRWGGSSLPSPPPSPTKRDPSRHPTSKARRFWGKFRSESPRNVLGLEAAAASGARPSTRDLLKGKRRAISRHTPKRPGHSRLPMPVRFTEQPTRAERRKPATDEMPALHRLTLDAEPVVSTRADRIFAERLSPPPETFDYVPKLSKSHLEGPTVSPDEAIDALLNEKPLFTLELNSTVEESIEAQRKSHVSDEEVTREHITNMHKHDIRAPLRPLLGSMSEEMKKRTSNTIYAPDSVVLAKAADSTPLHRHDFLRVIPPTEWLNDEIVNGVLSWLDQAVNHIGGVDDPKAQTRKCLVMTSFYYKQIKMACKNTQRTLKRKGITKDNLLNVNTILLPICEHSHWTLMVINPSKRTVAHIDSLNPRGTISVTDLALRWMKDALDEKFVESEWSVVRYQHPAQTNGYDCGVHTICNAICVAVGVDCLDSYRAREMPELRLQVSAVLVNGGFTGELDLLGL